MDKDQELAIGNEKSDDTQAPVAAAGSHFASFSSRWTEVRRAIGKGFSLKRPYVVPNGADFAGSPFAREMENYRPLPDGNWEKQAKTFELFISYIRHENELTNQRTSWFLLSQALIGAGAGYVFSKHSRSVLSSLKSPDLHFNGHVAPIVAVWLLIGFTGVVVSATARNSIDAANLSRDSIRHLWSKAVIAEPALGFLPDMLGGKLKEEQDTGGDFASDLPTLAWAGWCVSVGLLPLAYTTKALLLAVYWWLSA